MEEYTLVEMQVLERPGENYKETLYALVDEQIRHHFLIVI